MTFATRSCARGLAFIALGLTVFMAAEVKADVMVGPTSFGTVGGSDTYWGIQFTALHDSTLTSFDYNHRDPVPFGNPITGTVSLNDLTTSTTVYTQNYGPDAPKVITYTPNVALHGGDVYQLVASSTVVSGANDELFEYSTTFGFTAPAYPAANSDIVVTQGAFSSGGFENAAAWGAFTNISTLQSVPEPSSVTLLGLGVVGIAGAAWRKRRLTA